MTNINTDEPLALNIKLTGAAAILVKQLSERHGITPDKVISKALATENYFAQETQAGSKIFLQRVDESIRQVTFN